MFVKGKKRRALLLVWMLAGAWLFMTGCGGGTETSGVNEERGAASAKQMEELNRTADELYRLAEAGEFDKARGVLERLGVQAAEASYAGITGVEGVNALTDAIVEAKRCFNAASMHQELCVKQTARLMLATDALTHPGQPMWMQYYKVLAEDTRLFEQAVAAGDAGKAKSSLDQLKDHYGMIRPAVKISRAPEEGERADSALSFFTRYSETGEFQQETLANAIPQWREALNQLFGKNRDRTAYMSAVQQDKPVLWTATVGSLVIVVLGFAAWRMFWWEKIALGPRSGSGGRRR